MPPVESAADEKLRNEFNRWADDGRGEEMERHHIPITAPVLGMMELRADDRILDLGCGAGWATRLLAVSAPRGEVVGVDISDEMVRRAKQASKQYRNVTYRLGSAEKIPAEDDHFNKVLSVESFYYYPDQGRALDELYRVMAPGGRFFILINLYADNPSSLRWAQELKVPVHALSEKEYVELIAWHGFHQVQAARIPDESPTPEEYSGKWFKNAAELREFKRIGALLLMGTKPN